MKTTLSPRNQISLAECFIRQITASFAFAILLVISLVAPNLQAQTTIKPKQFRVEIPTGFNGTYLLVTNVMRVATNGASPDITGTNWVIPSVSLSISGAPSGVTATFVDASGNLVTTVPITLNTNNASQNTNLIVKLVFDGTQAGGLSTLGLNMTGGMTNGYFPLTLEVGKIWNGNANAALNGAGNWVGGGLWLGGGDPTADDCVVFTDIGAQTNSLLGTATSTNYLTNVVVNSSVVISSLRFAMTNLTGTPGTNFQNIYINNGVNLAIKGPGGFSMLRDYTYLTVASGTRPNVIISGTNGTLIQTNESSDFSILIDGQSSSIPNSILDMSGLGNLKLNVNRVAIGDILAYPNYWHFVTNGYTPGSTFASSRPSKCLPNWKMAMTNVVRSVYVDPYNYGNATNRSYAIEIGRNETTGGSSGNYGVSMGLTNSFLVDGLCVAGYASLGGTLNFITSNSFALFRNTNGGRMSVIALGDAAGSSATPALANNTKCGNTGFGVDFTRGAVDILVDRFYMSMDRGYTTGSGVCQSSMGMSAGVVDANSAFIGYQASGNQTNGNSCTATLTITNTAVFRVNGTLALGYTTASPGDPSLPSSTKGVVNIGPGGTVLASNIYVGGTTKASAGNAINMSGNATLVVSNAIADATANGALGTLTFAGGNNTIKLFIDGSNPAALIYVTNFTASGTGNKLVIGGVKNLTYPADVIIVQGAGAPVMSSASFDGGVTMPAGSGLTGSLSTDTGNNRIMLHIINRTGNNLVWRGNGSTADWDYTSTNWMNQANGALTNYDNPDTIAFDDAANVATNINIAGGSTPLTPGAINMTNNINYYTFLNGGNVVNGGPSLNKYGTGTVQVEGNTSFNVQLNQGQFVGFGAGTIGNANIGSGSVMNYGGNMSGSLAVAGTATYSSGTISGTLIVQSGGIMTNSGTINNSIQVLTNGFLYNSGTLANVGVGSSASPQIAKGGTFVNNGTIGAVLNGNILYVNGTFQDVGGGGDNITVQSVTIGAGGVFLPGNASTGTTIINSDGTGTFPGASLLVQGSTNVFNINVGGTGNTVLRINNLSFGASSSARNQNGATIQIVNTGVSPFSAGQSFHLFDNLTSPGSVPYNTGSSTNTYPVITPATPGAGLAWDLSQLWVSGNIGVVNANSGPTVTNSFTIINGTNIVGQFSWDASYLGYRLQSQVNPLSIGLSTNWSNANNNDTNVGPSWTGTTYLITNNITTNAVFYRLTFP